MIIIINSNSTKNDRKTTDACQRRGVGPSRYRLDLVTWVVNGYYWAGRGARRQPEKVTWVVNGYYWAGRGARRQPEKVTWVVNGYYWAGREARRQPEKVTWVVNGYYWAGRGARRQPEKVTWVVNGYYWAGRGARRQPEKVTSDLLQMSMTPQKKPCRFSLTTSDTSCPRRNSSVVCAIPTGYGPVALRSLRPVITISSCESWNRTKGTAPLPLAMEVTWNTYIPATGAVKSMYSMRPTLPTLVMLVMTDSIGMCS